MDGSETGLNTFDVRRWSPHPPTDVVLYFEAPRGTPIMRAAADSGVLANGRFNGFLTRDVKTGGPNFPADHIFPGRGALPFTVGDNASIQHADEVELEGAEFLQTTGSGSVDDTVAVGQKMTPHSGKWGKTQTGETAYYEVTAVLEPVDTDNNTFRLRMERLGA